MHLQFLCVFSWIRIRKKTDPEHWKRGGKRLGFKKKFTVLIQNFLYVAFSQVDNVTRVKLLGTKLVQISGSGSKYRMVQYISAIIHLILSGLPPFSTLNWSMSKTIFSHKPGAGCLCKKQKFFLHKRAADNQTFLLRRNILLRWF